MMKAAREVQRIARNHGIPDATVVPGDPHARINGTIDGHPVSIVVSLSQALTNPRGIALLKKNIRIAAQKVRSK